MRELAYLDGQLVDAQDALLPVTDWGFVQGVTVAEQLRTFRGEPFLVGEHMERLRQGLKTIGLPDVNVAVLETVIQQLTRHNLTANAQSDVVELGVSAFVTPGTYPSFRTGNDEVPSGPRVCVHTYPLSLHRWHDVATHGCRVVRVTTRQVPTDCWPLTLKCRSRAHYYLADREAKQIAGDAIALLLDQNGFVSETPTANIAAYFQERGIVAPSDEHALPGISLSYLHRLADSLKIRFQKASLRLEDLYQAHELWLTSTPYGMLPVRQLDDTTFPAPGPRYRELTRLWSERVGVDLLGRDFGPSG